MSHPHHGMGVRHSYGEGESADQGCAHEFKGHGVSAAWIKQRTDSGLKTATPKRAGTFHGRMEGHKVRTLGAGGQTRHEKKMHRKYGHAAERAFQHEQKSPHSHVRQTAFNRGYNQAPGLSPWARISK